MTESVQGAPASSAARFARWVLPFIVSAALLAWVLSTIDVRGVWDELTVDAALVFVPALAVFLVVSLLLEAMSLVVVISHSRPFHDLWVAARIKAATYVLGTVNYALGAGGLTWLVRQRGGMSLAEAASAVLVISLFDLGSVIGLGTAGIALMGAGTLGLQAGYTLLLVLAIVGGFVVLRAPVSMGPIDRLRELTVFRDARTLPIPLLAKLAALRVAFVGSFILLAAATLRAFAIEIPPLDLVVNVSVLLLVSALPIAVAGLGTGQVVFVELFKRWAEPEALLAASLTLSFGLIVTRCTIGLTMAREFTREALAAQREDAA